MTKYGPAILSCVLLCGITGADEMEWIRISDNGKGFVFAESGRRFVPWGFNYDHDRKMRLLEDYWDDKWSDVEADFREMKELRANVVRIHLQFGRFMESPIRPNQQALNQLARLLRLAEQIRVYLDLTGLACYHKQDVPEWFDRLSEQDRWAAQAAFWEAVAGTCRDSPAVFFYDLMNEPIVPHRSDGRSDEWLDGPFGDKYFGQFVTLDVKGRDRHEIARSWIANLTSAIRRHDQRHLITVGLLPWSLDRPGKTSGFTPHAIVDQLDFIACHSYPESGRHNEAVELLKGFAAAGKLVIIEETFPLLCNGDELGQFIDASRQHAAGWIGFYWGRTSQECRQMTLSSDVKTLEWLELYQRKTDAILSGAAEL